MFTLGISSSSALMGGFFFIFFEHYPLGQFGDRLGSDNETGGDRLADMDGHSPDLKKTPARSCDHKYQHF